MLKRIKPVSMVLLASTLCFSGNIYSASSAGNPDTDISQQNAKVTGTVEDALGPVAGASVVIKGTTNGTMTDMDGNFTLDGVKNGDIIQISFIGYATQEIPYAGQASLSVHLEEDTQKLDEVVVTALGMKRDKKALGYAMQETSCCLPANQIWPIRCLVKFPVYRLYAPVTGWEVLRRSCSVVTVR